jgi:hypothetical protein
MLCNHQSLLGPFSFHSLSTAAALIFISLVFASPAGAAAPHLRLTPQLLPGQTLRYQIDSRDIISGQTTAPVANPEGATHSTQNIHIVVRLDVIGPVAGVPGVLRVRATCEKSSAEFQGDALDLSAAGVEERYNRMEGHMLEFIVQPTGQVVGVQGSDAVFGDNTTAAALLSWLGRITYGGVPRRPIGRGEKWSGGHLLPDAPLSGLTWHAESTYLRDEPCGPSAITPGTTEAGALVPASAEGQCGVILTRFQISRSGSAKSDATPEEYRHNGLRTSGKWTGSGESFDSISLAHGLLVSSTQTSVQDLDYQITGAATGSSIHHKGRTESRSVITLLPSGPASPQ